MTSMLSVPNSQGQWTDSHIKGKVSLGRSIPCVILKALGIYSKTLLALINTTNIRLLYMHLSDHVIPYLKFLKHFLECIMQIQAICYLATTPDITLFTLLPLCALCSSNAKLLPVSMHLLQCI